MTKLHPKCGYYTWTHSPHYMGGGELCGGYPDNFDECRQGSSCQETHAMPFRMVSNSTELDPQAMLDLLLDALDAIGIDFLYDAHGKFPYWELEDGRKQ